MAVGKPDQAMPFAREIVRLPCTFSDVTDILYMLWAAGRIDLAFAVVVEIADSYLRARALGYIADKLRHLPTEQFYPFWETLLQRAVSMTRAEVFEIVSKLPQTLKTHGAEPGIDEGAQAIRDVVRLWP